MKITDAPRALNGARAIAEANLRPVDRIIDTYFRDLRNRSRMLLRNGGTLAQFGSDVAQLQGGNPLSLVSDLLHMAAVDGDVHIRRAALIGLEVEGVTENQSISRRALLGEYFDAVNAAAEQNIAGMVRIGIRIAPGLVSDGLDIADLRTQIAKQWGEVADRTKDMDVKQAIARGVFDMQHAMYVWGSGRHDKRDLERRRMVIDTSDGTLSREALWKALVEEGYKGSIEVLDEDLVYLNGCGINVPLYSPPVVERRHPK